jgi:hypothetical protein
MEIVVSQQAPVGRDAYEWLGLAHVKRCWLKMPGDRHCKPIGGRNDLDRREIATNKLFLIRELRKIPKICLLTG